MRCALNETKEGSTSFVGAQARRRRRCVRLSHGHSGGRMHSAQAREDGGSERGRAGGGGKGGEATASRPTREDFQRAGE
jgi:hypothetical protein